ncbi:MORC family CW-type zinc finger protein 3a isoform X2 [Hypomesus transpacificus]|uniref:MORC family CW-type zinc finger protein 3a isoform X2 n=1 Tax=Hypomesus transpacificus TaxID=137520 RepID=UPI001F07621E|nr:MORC family CW-type zinc finger protein 3a isoform X2 [Hypomesus transpacificus]
MALLAERGVPLSALCPKYLHSNSTSHTRPFSAMAELIDNAYDPDVNAKQFWIDKMQINNEDCLIFMDNGNGLDYDKMHKMLSFGYSDKTASHGREPIGIYGNGFKSGSMRLGRDALVLSKSQDAVCVGLLSQSYLEAIKATQIQVPIVSFQCSSHNSDRSLEWDQLRPCEDHRASLKDILTYSLLKTEDQLVTELRAIVSTWSTGATGTRIILWNLRRTSSGETEYDLTDRYDIKIPYDVYTSFTEEGKRPVPHANSVPDTDLSLRAYCAILYLKPRMQVIIQGQKVKNQLISKSLAYVCKDQYKPNFLPGKRIPITFGYNTKSKDQYGIMMYHKNRLIKAYERVGCQNQANNKGVGVIGVIECNFLKPTHNKQDFDNEDSYRKTMKILGTKLEDYWKEINHKRLTKDPNNKEAVEDIEKRPDQNWVQCNKCLKWRKLPDGIDCDRLPDEWYCLNNPDPQYRNCAVDQEIEDSDDEQPYQKTYKLQEKKLLEEKERKKKEEELAKAEEERARKDAARKTKLKELAGRNRRRCPAGTDPPPLDTEKSRASPLYSPQHSSLSQGASSPSSGSMSTPRHVSSTPLRKKRTQPKSLANEIKRARLEEIHGNTSLPVTPTMGGNASSSNVFAYSDDDNDDTILETSVTCDQVAGNAAIDSLLNMATMGSNSSVPTGTNPSPPPVQMHQLLHTSVKVQTETPTIVKEEQEQCGSKIKEEAEGDEERRKHGTFQQEEDRGQEERRQYQFTKINEDARAKNNSATHIKEDGDLGDEGTRPSCSGASRPDPQFDTTEAQNQQDQLMELMQAVARERDTYREQVHQMTSQLQETESRLQQLQDQKTEHAHRPSHTDRHGGEGEGEAGRDAQSYKHLYEQAKREAEQLRLEKSDVSHSTEEQCTVSDEMALQVDQLLQTLDQRNNERDMFQNQVQCLEVQNIGLISQCEHLQKDLEEMKVELERAKAALAERQATGPGGSQTGVAHPRGQTEGESGTAGRWGIWNIEGSANKCGSPPGLLYA